MASKSNQPKIELPRDSTNTLIRIATLVVVIGMFLLAAFSYADLPDKIPVHFNAKGEADGYGPKSTIWILPILTAVMAIAMNFVSKIPHTYNFPSKITEENAPRMYAIASRMMVFLNFITAGIFAYILWGSIRKAQGQMEGLGSWFLITTLLGMGILLVYFTLQLSKNK
jgi:uncharacterized membrane protein